MCVYSHCDLQYNYSLLFMMYVCMYVRNCDVISTIVVIGKDGL